MNKTAAVIKREMEEAQAKTVELQMELAKAKKREAKDFAKKVKSFIEDGGYSVDEIAPLFKGGAKAGKKTSVSVKKYINPNNPNEIWSYRGGTSGSFKEFVKSKGLDPASKKDRTNAYSMCDEYIETA